MPFENVRRGELDHTLDEFQVGMHGVLPLFIALESFDDVQDTPKVPTPSSSQRPTREAKGKRGHAKGRLHVDMKEKIKVSNSEAPL